MPILSRSQATSSPSVAVTTEGDDVDMAAARELRSALVATGMPPMDVLVNVATVMGPQASFPVFEEWAQWSSPSEIVEALREIGESVPETAQQWLWECLARRDITGWDTPNGVAVSLEGVDWVTGLPEGLKLRCGLDMSGCEGLTRLPDGLRVCGDRLALERCLHLVSLPMDLEAKVGDVRLAGCTAWDGVIPAGVDAKAVYSDRYPAGIPLADWRVLHPDGEKGAFLPDHVFGARQAFERKKDLSNGLPEQDFLLKLGALVPEVADVWAQEWLLGRNVQERGATLCDTGWLRSLPNGFCTMGNANFEGNPHLEDLPEFVSVAQDLRLSRCVNLKSIPTRLEVGGSLWLSGCTSLESLPQGLHVAGGLILRGCVAWDGQIPEGAWVGGRIITDEDPGGLTMVEWRLREDDRMPRMPSRDEGSGTWKDAWGEARGTYHAKGSPWKSIMDKLAMKPWRNPNGK